MTVRDPISWVESVVNKSSEIRKDQSHWIEYEKKIYGKCYAAEEESIEKEKKPSIRQYLEYWSHHINYVIKNVPKERLKVIDVSEIDETQKYKKFIGLNEVKLEPKKSNNRKIKKFTIQGEEKERVKKEVKKICSDVVNKRLPKRFKKYIKF
jgi:hypothetical protein